MVDLSIAMLVYQRVKTVKQLDFDKADGNIWQLIKSRIWDVNRQSRLKS